MAEIIELDLHRHRRPRRPQGDIDARLRQSDLEEAIRLRGAAHAALKALREKQDYLTWHLLNGTPVESGPHTARLAVVNRATKQVAGASFYRLIIK